MRCCTIVRLWMQDVVVVWKKEEQLVVGGGSSWSRQAARAGRWRTFLLCEVHLIVVAMWMNPLYETEMKG